MMIKPRRDRPEHGRHWLSISLWLLLSVSPTAHVHGSEDLKPNVVFIMADDLGYGDVGCYNPESKIRTPVIDELARRGMRFTDAHAPGAVCVPTRYGLLTGQYPFRRDLKSAPKIADDTPTIASLLRDHGYATAMVGKWHLGFEKRPDDDWSSPLLGGPVDRGFDSYFGIPASLDIPPYYYIRSRHPLAPPTERIGPMNTPGWTPIQGEFWREGGIAPGFKHADVLPRLGDEAAAVIAQHHQRNIPNPLFLYVALTAPHTPWLPTEEFQGESAVELYGDFVMQVDSTVGLILDALDQNNMRDNTLVIFTSDNGPVWFEPDAQRFGHRSSGPLRGMKGDAWEGGHRMPFVACWPDHVPADSECHETICFTDMMATFAAIVGADAPRSTLRDSYSILPLLLAEKPATPIRPTTIHKRDGSAIRAGRWKLITHRGSGGISDREQPDPDPASPPGQLYDLDADIGETVNLWMERPDVVQRLTGLLEEYRREVPHRE